MFSFFIFTSPTGIWTRLALTDIEEVSQFFKINFMCRDWSRLGRMTHGAKGNEAKIERFSGGKFLFGEDFSLFVIKNLEDMFEIEAL